MKPGFIFLILLVCTSYAQDVNQDGIPVLVRPKEKVQPAPAPKPKPKPAPVKKADASKEDPLAAEKKRLKEWESSLAMTADSLTERLRAVAERERLLAEKERAIQSRRAAIEARKTAIDSREEAIESARISALPPSSPLEAVNKELSAPSDVKVKRWTGPNAPSIVGAHAMVLDAVNGRILHNKDAGELTPAADLMQLMTALIICESGELDRQIKIVEADTQAEGNRAGLRANDSYQRSELLQWFLIASGSDVASALARDNAGTVDAFVAKMNERGKRLGLKNTTFKNPGGLDASGQVTTARDLALLAWECYHQSFIREAVKTKSLKLTIAGQTRYATNPNKLLGQMGACNGMKLGKSPEARTGLITSAEQHGRERIVVVLRSTDSWIFKDTRVLVDWALRSD
tara:strand:- start:25113 stop:26321 length:1209 start_codon:yes stop_codon:yes gene_type:complete